METTWGELTDDDAGATITLTFPWSGEPASGVFVIRGEQDGWHELSDDEGNPTGERVPTWRHRMVYEPFGTDPNGFSFRTDLPVTVTPAVP